MTSATRIVLALLALALAAALPVAAHADSTPVGPLPKPKVTTVTTARGSLVSVTAPSRPASTGLVWRVARPVNARVVRQVGEGEIGRSVVLVFQAVGRGKASVVLALTKGDASPKAVAAIRYDIRVG